MDVADIGIVTDGTPEGGGGGGAGGAGAIGVGWGCAGTGACGGGGADCGATGADCGGTAGDGCTLDAEGAGNIGVAMFERAIFLQATHECARWHA